MQRIAVSILAFVLSICLGNAFAYEVSDQVFSYSLSLKNKSKSEVRLLVGELQKQGIDIAGFDQELQTMEILVSAQELERISLLPLSKEFLSEGSGRSAPAPQLDSRYLDPAEIEAVLKDLNAKYPDQTQLLEIGKSLEGRSVWALVVSSTPDIHSPGFQSKPSFLIDGLHHAREVMTPEIPLDFARQILASQNQSGRQSEFQKNWNLIIVPMLNVDGSQIVWTDNTFWRKNARSGNGRIFGVDLNRNYAYEWGACNGSSGSTYSDAYRGAGPSSEPETQALLHLAEWVRPNLYVSYHSYGEMVLYPYGCNGAVTGENDFMGSIAQNIAGQLRRESGNGNYSYGTPWDILYGVDGDSMSHLYAYYGALSISFEVGRSFQPTFDKRDPLVAQHRNVLFWLGQTAESHLLKVRVRTSHQESLVAQVEVREILQENGEAPFTTNSQGYFFKVLSPGLHHVSVRLANGLTQESTVLIGGSSQELEFIF